MNSKLGYWLARQRACLAGWVLVALAVAVIGCGGGGGGGGTSTTSATGSTTATNSSTSSSSTSTSATTGTTGSTAGSGALPANVIFYTQLDGTPDNAYDIRYITPNGTTDTALVTGIPGTFELVAINPNNGQYVFAAQATAGANYGIYSNTTVSLTGATQIIAPTFNDVASLNVSQDGAHIVFLGALTSTSNYGLYVITPTSGLTIPIDTGNTSTISPDNVTVAYSNFSPSTTQIFLYNITSGTKTQLTSNANFNDYPQFSKDGTHLLYAQLPSGGTNYSLVYSNGSGSSVKNIPNPSGLDIRGGSLNSSASTIAFVGRSSSTVGLYTIALSGSPQTTLKTSPLLSTNGVYWTTTLGRGIGSPALPASRVTRRRHMLP